MSRFKLVSLGCFLSLSLTVLGDPYLPSPLPKGLLVSSSTPLATVWSKLTDREKQLAFHLTKAANLGRTLMFYQSHRYSLAIRDMLVKSLEAAHIKDTKALLGDTAFQEYLTYAALFLNQGGPYSGSNRKYVLSLVTADNISDLFTIYSPKALASIYEIAELMTDPAFEVERLPEVDSDELKDTGGNLYDKGITTKEVKAAVAAGFVPKLNCRVVRKFDSLACQLTTIDSPGVIGKTLRAVVESELKLAKIYATTDHQRAQIDFLVAYFTYGNEEDFRSFNKEWVKDRNNSTVDFMMGWVEVYDDWQSSIGAWESYVQVIDPTVSKLAENLAKNAQYFEDNMPYGPWKKTFPADYSPPAIMVYYFQEIADSRSGGYNLPNYDDIRRDVGAKNVIKLPLPGTDQDPQLLAIRVEANKAFSASDKVDEISINTDKTYQRMVLLHEIIGHGSGTYDESKYPNKIDPITALGKDTNGLGSPLEEQRADQTALVFISDPKWIQLGVVKDAAESVVWRNRLYDYYISDFLRRFSKFQTFTEAHIRGRYVLMNKLLEKGAIHWVAKDGTSPLTIDNQVLAVKDYDLFHSVSVDLLAQLQLLKATRDAKGIIDLFAQYSPLSDANKDWAKAIVKRGANLMINAGSVEQPWKITDDLKVVTFGTTTLEGAAPFWSTYYQAR